MHSAATFAICLLLPLTLRAADWPAHHEIAKETTSPDGHYAILAPNQEAESDSGDIVDLLIDVPAHRVLGKIAKSDYQIGLLHTGVHADWRPDSGLCVVQFDAKYGISSGAILVPKGDTFQQFDVGVKMTQSLAAAIHPKKGTPVEPSFASHYAPDGKILFRAWTDYAEKRVAETVTIAIFTGTFDMATGKWLSAEAKRVDLESADDLYSAYNPSDPAYASFSAENKAEAIDHALNQAYRVLKVMLPAKQFAELKKEQAAWLKERDAIPADEARTKFVEARVKALKARLWE